jgi:hypothetical protein
LKISLDATYSVGENLSGVGVYSRELVRALAASHPQQRFELCYRPHRYTRSFAASLAPNCSRALLFEPIFPRSRAFFHGLNQRLPGMRFRKTVSTFHDLFVLTGDYSTPEFRRRFAAQARQAAALSDAIIAVSAFTARQVEQLLGVERSRIHVVHRRQPDAAAEADGARKCRPQRGCDTKRKNIARLVDAFERTRAAGSWCWPDRRVTEPARFWRASKAARGADIQARLCFPDELADWYAARASCVSIAR